MEEITYYEKVDTSVELPEDGFITAIEFPNQSQEPYIAEYMARTKEFMIFSAGGYKHDKIKYWYKPI